MRAAAFWGVLGAVIPALIFSLAEAEEIRYDSQGRRDPFLSRVGPDGLVATGLSGGGIAVEGIIFDPDKGSYALISGEIYREGDSVGAAKLIRVLPDRVILMQESEAVVIWIHEENLEKDKKEVPQEEAPV